VFAVANDPVGSGFVASLSRPGGNITGLSLQATSVPYAQSRDVTRPAASFFRCSALFTSALAGGLP